MAIAPSTVATLATTVKTRAPTATEATTSERWASVRPTKLPLWNTSAPSLRVSRHGLRRDPRGHAASRLEPEP